MLHTLGKNKIYAQQFIIQTSALLPARATEDFILRNVHVNLVLQAQ